jgi:hypothetical protein
MANKKITDLQPISNVTDSDNFPADDGTQTYRITAPQIKAYILAANAILTAMIADAQVTAAKLATAAVDLASSKITGILPAANGGFGAAAFYHGYTSNAAAWSTTSGSYANGTNTGGNALTQRVTKNMTVTAAASNVAGITFTPPSITAAYEVFVKFAGGAGTQSTAAAFKLTDGTIVVDETGTGATFNGGSLPVVLKGPYVPGVLTPVTLKIMMASVTNSGTTTAIIAGSTAGGTVASSIIEWDLVQISP